MTSPIKASVRMYRQGLGDCFLLTFKQGSHTSRVLIDCGVVLGAPAGNERTQSVVEQLEKDCKGELDVVVATHEHWDHVSGFATARELFDKINIGEIWMAWTEDPKDRQAKRLRNVRAERVKSLAAAVKLWEGAAQRAERPFATDSAREGVALAATRSLLDFFGPGDLAAKGDKTREALDYLKKHSAPKKYLEPGDEEALPGVKGVRVYTLGPPRDEKLIKKDQPSKSAPETYEQDMRLSGANAFFSAVAPADEADGERYQPFDHFYRIPVQDAKQQPFFRENYGFTPETPATPPSGGPGWRRIDEDWLSMTSELALMLDSDTNNTSLVLAFELGEEGDVLLFAADAQVGNWSSWESVKFARRGVTADALLARTVFYKVGHHASHNATLREKGLEKMTSRRLAAFIPVDRKTAHKIGWKKMPFNPLLERLRERCRNRIVRLDEGVDGDAGKTFAKSITEHDLFFDLELG